VPLLDNPVLVIYLIHFAGSILSFNPYNQDFNFPLTVHIQSNIPDSKTACLHASMVKVLLKLSLDDIKKMESLFKSRLFVTENF